jgi:hypothetical protein
MADAVYPAVYLLTILSGEKLVVDWSMATLTANCYLLSVFSKLPVNLKYFLWFKAAQFASGTITHNRVNSINVCHSITV